MVQLIKPAETKVITKNGEATLQITLDLNINLNSNGLSASVQPTEIKEEKEEKNEESSDWAIGDFSPPKKKIKFGKKV